MSSTHIYPYVYIGTHKITGEFYIGSRVANLVPAHADLGTRYRTSSKYVEPIFAEFEWEIVAEFFDKVAAYSFEQELIAHNIGNAKMINRSCFYGKRLFSMAGKTHSIETREKMQQKRSIETREKMSMSFRKRRLSQEQIDILRESNIGRVHTDETRQKMSDAHKGLKHSDSTRSKIKSSLTGVKHTDERREAVRAATTGKIVKCPHCLKEGSYPSMMRWHFDNCKVKLSTTC